VGVTRQKCVLVVLDAVLLTAAYLIAFALRLSWRELEVHVGTILATLPVVVAISLVVHLRFGLFHAILRYASLDTAFAVLKSVLWSVAIVTVVMFLTFRLDGIPRSVFVIYAMAALLLVGAARLAVRFRSTRFRSTPRRSDRRTRPVILYGAVDTAELVLRGLSGSDEIDFTAVAILDDDRTRIGRQMYGVRIHATAKFSELVERCRAQELWVCTPHLPGAILRQLYQSASREGVQVKILPRLRHAMLGQDIARFQEPRIADLLRRPPRSLDRARMRDWIRGRRVLITGAGGSIGRELTRQVANLGPQSLALCDACEANLFDVHGQLSVSHGAILEPPYLVDIRDAASVGRMFRQSRPDVVFHAAAYKHVPLVELNPCEGVLTNVQGLCNVALAAAEFEVADFVFISTDKAVRPVNVMGATKRLGERIIQVLDREVSTRFCAVRFGNVLGSSGSVVPIFQSQIRRGGPVTVTHPDMERYFMLVSEAAELVIQAGSIGKGGEVFILDMGEPVRIADMARDLIRLMGKEPDREIEVRFTGPRPGEKIHEELLISSQDSCTAFEDIWIDGEPVPDLDWSVLAAGLRPIFEAARAGDPGRVASGLRAAVPEFVPAFDRTRDLLEQHDEQEPEMVALVSRTCALRPRRTTTADRRFGAEAVGNISLQ